MNFTYVGEWIEWKNHFTTEKRMIEDLTYIYANPEEFDDWKSLFNDGADIFVVATGKGRLYLFDKISELLNKHAKVQTLQ